MKKIRDIVIGVVSALVVMLILGIAGWYETHYTITGTVVKVNTFQELVTVEDNDGNLWEFYGTDFKISDTVKMVMDTNCTYNDIEDDEIEKVNIVF